MPQVRSANVMITPPCTRPRRLWCLFCATSAYSCSPLTTRCHSGPIRCRKPVVSTTAQPEALSFSVGLSVIAVIPIAEADADSGHFINRGPGGWKRDGLALHLCHKTEYRGPVRSFRAPAGGRAGRRLEAGRG